MDMFNRLKKIFTREPALSVFHDKRILAIDDDRGQRAMIQKTLEGRGFTVLTAENGKEGLDLALSEVPDLIILDAVMPEMRGEEVCKRLKANLRTKDIPVLFLTSMDDPKDVIAHYDLGAEIHLTKPINPTELLAQIEITFSGK